MAEKGVFGFFCPHCNKEITYNMTYYNDTIAELKADINKIQCELISAKYNSEVEKDWKRRATQALQIKQKQLAELKSYRHAANEYLQWNIERTLCAIVKEKYGLAVYKELIEKAEERCKQTNATKAMRQEYTRADGKKIVKV